jgi:hypothetical protein
VTIIPNDAANSAMYHVGLVVADLEETAAQYTDLFGMEWATPRRTTLPVIVDGERVEPELIVSYSVNGPPYIELMQELSGDVWAADALRLDHIGFWTPDLDAAVAQFKQRGLPSVVREVAERNRFSFHRSGGGTWLELVASSFEAPLTAWQQASQPDE